MMDDIENAFVGIDLILETTSGSKPLNLTMWKPIFTEDTFEVCAGSEAERYLWTLSCWGKLAPGTYKFALETEPEDEDSGEQARVTLEFGEYLQQPFKLSEGLLTVDEVQHSDDGLYVLGNFEFSVEDERTDIEKVGCWEFTIGDRA
ncbi:hypothetical protein ABE525_14040 [Pseudomonas wadenswilerensis]|uniref:hypothetical protein n=1 Tax=Pseudomonas TaxID=286 RepID=UPI00100CC8A9|nr:MULTISPECIES: hypothetical protein [unclassified Pseudomonas]MCE5983518.1 hypothetical protein [Pseudomonas sp. LF19]SPO67252.1 protein of unknown function [Pseudomonas sp. JV241A]